MTELDFGFRFPAIKGIQANREYFVTMCPMRLIPRIFYFDEESDVPADIRAQRVLNQSRVPEMARYMVNNREDYVFSAITASIDAETKFEPLGSSGTDRQMGTLSIPMDARFIINDGQHRRAAIIEALNQTPDLGDETISVVFFVDRGLKRCQQMFADLNRYAIRPSTSLGLLYDHRSGSAELARRVIKRVPLFMNIVELERSSLSRRSKKLFTFSAICHATNAFLGSHRTDSVIDNENHSIKFWESLAQTFPEWERVKKNEVSSGEVRQDYIHVHGVVLHALGLVGNALLAKFPEKWMKMLKKLNQMDWTRQNAKDWEGRAMVGGRLIKSQQHIILTANRMKKHLKLDLPEEHQKLEDAYLRGAHVQACA
jgi:DNA sulfur modification protein DndB